MTDDLEAFWSVIRPPPLPPTFRSRLEQPGNVVLMLGTERERKMALEYVSKVFPPQQNQLPCFTRQCARSHFISAHETLFAASRHYSDCWLGKPFHSPANIPLLPYTITRIVESTPLLPLVADTWFASKGPLLQYIAHRKLPYTPRTASDIAQWVTGASVPDLPDIPVLDRGMELFIAAIELGLLNRIWLTFDGLQEGAPIAEIQYLIEELVEYPAFTFLLGCEPEQRELALTIHPTPNEYLIYDGAFHEVRLDA